MHGSSPSSAVKTKHAPSHTPTNTHTQTGGVVKGPSKRWMSVQTVVWVIYCEADAPKGEKQPGGGDGRNDHGGLGHLPLSCCGGLSNLKSQPPRRLETLHCLIRRSGRRLINRTQLISPVINLLVINTPCKVPLRQRPPSPPLPISCRPRSERQTHTGLQVKTGFWESWSIWVASP